MIFNDDTASIDILLIEFSIDLTLITFFLVLINTDYRIYLYYKEHIFMEYNIKSIITYSEDKFIVKLPSDLGSVWKNSNYNNYWCILGKCSFFFVLDYDNGDYFFKITSKLVEKYNLTI